jgi:hypothetical protein
MTPPLGSGSDGLEAGAEVTGEVIPADPVIIEPVASDISAGQLAIPGAPVDVDPALAAPAPVAPTDTPTGVEPVDGVEDDNEEEGAEEDKSLPPEENV